MDLIPRTQLDVAHHSTIDSALKDLKQLTRRLQAALTSQQLELRILDKLYYKGNNQHRSALFWRRISEVRKFTRRFDSLRLQAVSDSIRMMFWGESEEKSQKNMKAAWSHVPSSQKIQTFLTRIRTTHTLVFKARECFKRAFEHLNLNLQTGAFLQFILTLSALVARLDHLFSEIALIVEELWSTYRKCLLVIDPLQSSKWTASLSCGPAPVLVDVGEHTTVSVTGSAVLTSNNSETYAPDADLGTLLVNEGQVAHDEDRMDVTETIPEQSFSLMLNTDIEFAVPSVVRTTRVRDTQVSAPSQALSSKPKEEIEPSASRQTPKEKTSKSKLVAKKKRTRNEIDDIFGF